MKDKTQMLPVGIDEAYSFHILLELEHKWKSSLKLTIKDLNEVFPEFKSEIVPSKIEELTENRNNLLNQIKRMLYYLRIRFPKDFWFLRILIKNTLVKDLTSIEEQLVYFKRSRIPSRVKHLRNKIEREQIERALSVPIENVIGQKVRLRRSGRNFLGLCPLHEERSPSFYIYTGSNRYYCFGCNQGGDSISLVRVLQQCSFREAVQHLT